MAHIARQQVTQGVQGFELHQVHHRDIDEGDLLPRDPTLQDQQRQPFARVPGLGRIDLIDMQRIGITQGLSIRPIPPKLLYLLIAQSQQQPRLLRRQWRVLPRREQACT